MLDNLKLFVNYAKAVAKYLKSAVDVLHTAVNNWPVWVVDIPKTENDEVVDVEHTVEPEPKSV